MKASKHDLNELEKQINDDYIKLKKFSGVENEIKNELKILYQTQAELKSTMEQLVRSIQVDIASAIRT